MTMSCYPLQVVSRMVMNRSGEVFYIGGNDILPAPLSAERHHWSRSVRRLYCRSLEQGRKKKRSLF